MPVPQKFILHSVALSGLVFLFAASLGAQEKQRRPNVLFIAIDDLNTRLNCYGFEHIRSPNIDRLARRGVRFGHAYCQFPSCGPSRASVLTGLRPDTTGMLHNRMSLRDKLPDLVTLPQLFRQNDYFVARVGKIFHQSNPTDIGTSGPDDPESWDHVVNPRGRDKDEEDQLIVYTPDLPLPDQMAYLRAEGNDDEQTDGKVALETVRLMKQHAGGEKPFFIAAGFYRPHIPYIAPKQYFEKYRLENTAIPALPDDYRKASGVPAAALASTPVWPNFGTTEQQVRECTLAYDACISFVDAQVGVVLDAVEKLGLAENTIIVLWGDHGYHLGEHGLWRKNSLFEESTRAPLIFAGAGIPAAENGCERVVEFVDIYPTVIELAGVRADKTHPLEGVSLTPLLFNPRARWTRPAFSQVQFAEAPGRNIRTDRWSYSEWGDKGDKGIELYDLKTDPGEMRNLIASKEFEPLRAKLRELLHQQFSDTAN